jgi:hypothetical protein
MEGPILDWGSGSGLLARLLRDSGHACFGFEPYTTPVLAAGYTYKTEDKAFAHAPYRAILAIEVIEHLAEPRSFVASAMAMTDTLIFSTELLSSNSVGKDWWYYSTETGQHIGFHTKQSLAHLSAEQVCMHDSCHKQGLHIFTRRSSDMRIFRLVAGRKRSLIMHPIGRLVSRLAGRTSLLMSDHLEAKKALTTG